MTRAVTRVRELETSSLLALAMATLSPLDRLLRVEARAYVEDTLGTEDWLTVYGRMLGPLGVPVVDAAALARAADGVRRRRRRLLGLVRDAGRDWNDVVRMHDPDDTVARHDAAR